MFRNMKRFYVFASLLLLAFDGFAQNQQILRDDLSGNVYKNGGSNSNIVGSPFFMDEWTPGVIYLKDGSKADKFQLKLDIFSNELLFLHQNKTLAVVNPVKEFVLTPATGMRYLFRCGFLAIERNTEATFYQVLQDGATALLKLNKKSLVDVAEYNKASTTKEYSLTETYYISKPGGYAIKIKKDRASFLEAIGDTTGKLKEWLDKNKNRCKTEEELMAAVEAFNSLY